MTKKRRGTHLVDELRHDNLADVEPKVGLELEAALGVEQKVLRKACPVLAEPLVERILAYEKQRISSLLK